MKLVVHKKAMLAVIAIASCSLAIGGAPPAPNTPAMDHRASLVTLRQERLATLREAQKIAERQYAAGIGAFEQVERVGHLVVDADLVLATSPKQRVEVLGNAVREAKKQELMAQKRADAGNATAVESLEAKAYRLELEIRMGEEELGMIPNR